MLSCVIPAAMRARMRALGEILDACENHSLAAAGVEPLVGFNLLS